MISILLSPDRSEMVCPMPTTNLTGYMAFIGVETGQRYDEAYLRTDQDPEITEQKLTVLSEINRTMGLFAPSDIGVADLVGMLVHAMLSSAQRLAESGYTEGDVVSTDDINTTRKEA